MTDAFFPSWNSDGTWDHEEADAEWPAPIGPSEWSLFRNWSAPKMVITDAAAAALEHGESVDSIIVTFDDGKMAVEAPMGVWEHVLVALSHEEPRCAECGELLDVFRRISETLGEEE